MRNTKTDYRQLAPTYNERYRVNRLAAIARALVSLVQDHTVRRVLEVGCGTGRWLAEIAPCVEEAHGLDPSADMLAKAQARPEKLLLQLGKAEALPYPDDFFDLVFCVNAIHHFDDLKRFVEEAHRVLMPDGVLAVIGMDPREMKERYDLYGYFPGTYETDLQRFPSHPTVAEWFTGAGFDSMQCKEVERIRDVRRGRDILNNPFLKKESCSQLALLTIEQYERGMARIRNAIEAGEKGGEEAVFAVDISLEMTLGRKSTGISGRRE